MLLLVDLRGILVPTSLLNDKFHRFHSFSHPSVKLYLDSINVEVNVLTEADKLGQRLLKTLLQVGF